MKWITSSVIAATFSLVPSVRFVRTCDGVTIWTTPLGCAVLVVPDAGPWAKPMRVTLWNAAAPVLSSVWSIAVAVLTVQGAASSEMRIAEKPPTVTSPPTPMPFTPVPGIPRRLPWVPSGVSWFAVAPVTW
jgi:hypothetical protein